MAGAFTRGTAIITAAPILRIQKAVTAGALHIQLAGNAFYFGKLYEKPTLGDPDRPVEYEDIARANRLLYGTAILALLVFWAGERSCLMACLKKGCLQLYCGDGKGKTTASVGLAVRAVGTGLKVLFCQVYEGRYFRRDQDASEAGDHLSVLSGAFWFFWNMSDEQKKEAQQSYTALFRKAWDTAVKEGYDVLVIDEIYGVPTNHGLIEQKQALDV